MSKTRIAKIKFQDSERKTVIEYQKWKPGERWDEYILTSEDPPLQTFRDEMNKLGPHICTLLELPASYADTIKVSGISLSYKDGIMGCVITCQKKLRSANSPLILNTPHMTEESYSETDESGNNLLSMEIINLVHNCMDHARDYINGKREQLQLELEDETPKNKKQPKATSEMRVTAAVS